MKNLIFTALFLGSFAGVFAQIPSYVPSNGLVGWWPFTGNANDLSVNGNNGTVNGATLTTDRFGNANQAYGFDGVNDYISLNSANLPYANSDRTISIWFLKQNNNSIWSHTALSYGSASQSNALMISVGNNNLFTVQGWANDIATNQPSSNSWENLVFTLSSGLGTIYYNGNLIATQNVANWNTIQSVFYIGTRCDLNNSFFFGNIDDIGIWNRALTQQEITNLYNANNGPQATISTANNSICAGQSATLTATVANSGTTCNTTGLPPSLNNGLVGYWPFCGNANDASGNGNNGTVNGATLTTDRFGMANSAYSFDGINDFINTQSSGPLGNSNRSLSIWLNSNSSNLSQIIGYGYQPPSGGEFNLLINQICPGITIDIHNNYITYTSINLTDGNWHNIVCVYDNSISSNILGVMIYVDGVLLINSNCQNPINVNVNTLNTPLNFGRYQVGYNYFNGQLDDIGIWNRALTQQEVTQLYNAGQATYSWSPGGATTPSITVTPAQTTTYTCTVTMNGATTTQSQTITVNALPNVSGGTNQTVCAGTSVTLSGSGASTYTWNNGVSNGVAFTPASTQTYTVTGTNANGCTNTAQVQVTVNGLPDSTISANGPTVFCNGGSVILSVPIGNNNSYTWFLNNVQIPGGVGNSYLSNISGNYSVLIVNEYNCSSNGSITVTVNPNPTTPVIVGPESVCLNSLNQVYSSSPNNNWLIWNINGANIYSGQHTNQVHLDITSVDTVWIELTAHDLATGCYAIGSLMVLVDTSVIAPPYVNVFPLGNDNDLLCAPQATNVIRWGKINKATNLVYLETSVLTYHNFITLDTSTFYYFVDHGSEGCYTRSYYNYPELVTQVQDLEKVAVWLVPNPVLNEFNIMSDSQIFGFITIENLEGKCVYQQEGWANTSINCANFMPGMYVLKLQNTSMSFVVKFLKL